MKLRDTVTAILTDKEKATLEEAGSIVENIWLSSSGNTIVTRSGEEVADVMEESLRDTMRILQLLYDSEEIYC